MSSLFDKWNDASNDHYRGAPLGQPSEGTAPATGIRLAAVQLDSGGYDSQGIYWGTGKKLYKAWAPGYLRHVRASSREEAADLLGLTGTQLIRS